ncbi:hypothetical protein R3P38DRAFT_2764881 [Favolaschia claudopus]|uniref:Uncharacterized protein n=1 Tax=Favolaschia claudopus TaxID=2862362 RepID=A0AAW0DCG1_9AGAR
MEQSPLVPNTVLVPMGWHFVAATRERLHAELKAPHKSLQAIMIPDGPLIRHWVWIRVPILHHVLKPRTAFDVDTERWFDASRGNGEAWSDIEGRTFKFDRDSFPVEPKLPQPYSVVVAPQNDTGRNVHPVNTQIHKIAPEVPVWRGNILIFRHDNSAEQYLTDVGSNFLPSTATIQFLKINLT